MAKGTCKVCGREVGWTTGYAEIHGEIYCRGCAKKTTWQCANCGLEKKGIPFWHDKGLSFCSHHCEMEYGRKKQSPEIAATVQLVEPIGGKVKGILDGTLNPRETLHVFVKGTMGQYLAATDSRVVIIKTGITGGSFFKPIGTTCNSFPYEQIASIDYQWAVLEGTLKIAVSGLRDWRLPVFESKDRAANIITFDVNSREKFMLVRDKINELRQAFQSKATPTMVADSIPDQIKKLAELRDAGILTSEEFESKKTELLKRM
jgi:hypothetical protein